MSVFKKNVNNLTKGEAVAILIGGIAAFTSGAYLSHLEGEGCIDRKQKWIEASAIMAAIYCTGIAERLHERKKLTTAINSLGEKD